MTTPADNSGDTVRIVFIGLRDDVPFAHRLRRVLKYALRAARLRALRVEDVVDGPMAGVARKPASDDARGLSGHGVGADAEADA